MANNYDKGVKAANKVLGPEGLGKLGTDKEVQEALQMKKSGIGKQEAMTEKLAGVTSRYEKMADEGMSSAAREAQRTKMAQQMSQASQMAGLRMGGAMGGAQGASAAAQQRSLMAQGMMGRANIERDIFLANEQAKLSGLQGMGQAIGAESQSLAQERAATDAYTSSLGDVKTFDIGQVTAEKQLRGSMGMQYEQMASAERAAKMAADAQVKMAKAESGGGITVVCTELHRQGQIPTGVWETNQEFGKYLYRVDPYGYYGYISWGLPLAKAMSKSKILTAIVAPFMKGWINYIAGEETLFNKSMYKIGRVFGNTLIQMKKLYGQASLRGY